MVRNAVEVDCVRVQDAEPRQVRQSRVKADLGKTAELNNCLAPAVPCGECSFREDCTDRELVEAVRKGLPRAQNQLYETYRQRVHALMMRMLGNPEEASDLAQDAFVRVFNRIGDFRGDSALGTWIHRVAVNEALQHLRRKRRYQRITDSIAEDPGRHAPYLETPEVALDVNAALDQLPGRMRQMVLLRYHDGLDYSEIAQMLGVKQGTVASGLNRARQQLRHLLQ